MKIINKQPIAFLKNLEKAFYKDNYQNRKLGRVGRPYGGKEKGEKSWDKIEDFYVKGSDENKLWDFWHKFQKSGDPSHMSSMRQIFEENFPKVDSWKQTTPNTGKATITALSKNGDIIAEIDLSGDKINLAALQTFMDKCYMGKGETEILVDKTETLKNAEGKRLDAIIEYSNSAKEEGVEGIKVADNATDEEKKVAIAKFYKEAAEGNADNLDEIIEEALADYTPEKEEEKVTFKNINDLPFEKEELTRGGWIKECTINGHSFIKRDKSTRFYGEYEVDDENVSKSEFLSLANKYSNSAEEKKEKIPLSSISVQGENEYKFVIGKSPKGRGNWAFKIGNDDVDKDPSKIFFVEGMYEEAKNKAKKEAQKRGNVYSVTLLP